MEKNSIIMIAVVAVILAIGGAALFLLSDNGDDDNEQTSDTFTCQDMTDEWVTMPKEIESIYACGPGALRFITYLGCSDLICGSDQLKNGIWGNPYMLAGKDHFEDPSVAAGSGEAMNLNLEQVLTCNKGQKPHVLFVDTTTANEFSDVVDNVKAAGVHVFVMTYFIEMVDKNLNLNPVLEKQIRRMGTALSVDDRADELVKGIKSMLNEIKTLSEGPSINGYLGGMWVGGNRGLGSTNLRSPEFNLTGVDNIAAGKVTQGVKPNGTTKIQNEKLIQIINDADDFKMFLDPSTWMFKPELSIEDRTICAALANKNLSGGNTTKAMVTTEVNRYGMDYDNVLVNGYLVAQHIRGLDADMIREKVDAVYTLFYGDKAVNSDGVKMFDQLDNNVFAKTKIHLGQYVTFTVDGVIVSDGSYLPMATVS